MFLTWSGAEASSHTNLCLCVPFLIGKQEKNMLVIFEGLICCLLVLLCCVIGIANGPVNMVFFYDNEVQERCIANGLIDRKTIDRNSRMFKYLGILPYFVFVAVSVFCINKAKTFLDGFLQLLAILMIEGIFDRVFIDWYWVNCTKAWEIPGTEDLKPYIDKKAMTRKWLGTLIGFPVISAILSFVTTSILK